MKFIPTAVAQKAAGQALRVRKNSPGLLLGAGILGMVGSTVLSCRATLKLEEVLTESQRNVHLARHARKTEADKYPEDEFQKDLQINKVRTAVAVAKLYAPGVVLGAASITCLTKSHHIMKERNLALSAAYAAVSEAFDRYRERVVEKYGEDEDQLLRYESETVEVVDDKGKTISKIRVSPNAEGSMYAKFFDEYSPYWNRDPDINRITIEAQQNYANMLLQTRGYVFLNEVYEMLGLDQTRAGQVVGWMVSDDGDNFIDFGIFNGDDGSVRDFINGRENSVLLDFNVDGLIWDKVPFKESLSWQK